MRRDLQGFAAADSRGSRLGRRLGSAGLLELAGEERFLLAALVRNDNERQKLGATYLAI
jgi:hypothetical protein